MRIARQCSLFRPRAHVSQLAPLARSLSNSAATYLPRSLLAEGENPIGTSHPLRVRSSSGWLENGEDSVGTKHRVFRSQIHPIRSRTSITFTKWERSLRVQPSSSALYVLAPRQIYPTMRSVSHVPALYAPCERHEPHRGSGLAGSLRYGWDCCEQHPSDRKLLTVTLT
jgi:hypothetical protein